VPGGGIGHLLQQPLVEIGTDAERRRDHTAKAQLSRVIDDLAVIRDTMICQTIGQQQTATDNSG